jgi:hypothetical protein
MFTYYSPASRTLHIIWADLFRVVLGITVVLILTATVASTRARSTKTERSDPATLASVSKAPPPADIQGIAASPGTGVMVIKITPLGFEPAEVTRPAGRYLLGVYNRSGLREVVLRLDRVTGNRVHEVRVPREKLDWRALVDLTPGSYLLTEANHPQWSCKLTIRGN